MPRQQLAKHILPSATTMVVIGLLTFLFALFLEIKFNTSLGTTIYKACLVLLGVTLMVSLYRTYKNYSLMLRNIVLGVLALCSGIYSLYVYDELVFKGVRFRISREEVFRACERNATAVGNGKVGVCEKFQHDTLNGVVTNIILYDSTGYIEKIPQQSKKENEDLTLITEWQSAIRKQIPALLNPDSNGFKSTQIINHYYYVSSYYGDQFPENLTD